MADEHINIKINAQDKASPAVDRISKKLRGLNAAVSFVSSTLETFGKLGRWIFFVGNAVDMISQKWKQFNHWINESKNAAIAETMRNAASEAKAAADAVDLLTAALEKQNKALSDRAAFASKYHSAVRDASINTIEMKKQVEISKLDPRDKDYDSKRAAIEDKFAKDRVNAEFEARRKANDMEIQRLRLELSNAKIGATKLEQQHEAFIPTRVAAYGKYKSAEQKLFWGKIDQEDFDKIAADYKKVEEKDDYLRDQHLAQLEKVKLVEKTLKETLTLQSSGRSQRDAQLLAIDNAAARRKASEEMRQENEKAQLKQLRDSKEFAAIQAQNAKDLSKLTAQSNMGIKASDRIASMGGFATKGIAAVAGAAIKLDPKVMQLRGIQRILSSQKSTLEDIKQAIEDSESISQFGR